MPILAILETSLYADDLDAAEQFYGDVLGLELHSREAGRHVFFRCGGAMVLIFDPRATSVPPRRQGAARVPPHGASGPGHVAFRVEAGELPAWRTRLAGFGIPIEADVHWGGGSGRESIYVRDPAGNSIELATGEIWGL